ncbi:hypothetical protein ACQ4LE_006207 [Meloidogyne hapla]|uniref:HMG box domain-containing protein n=1 Tax=Meloidogyne hapla TaxID=6305 RepID=A0A1I8B1H6_MELHA
MTSSYLNNFSSKISNNFQNFNKNNKTSIKQKLNNQIQNDFQQNLFYDDLDGIEPSLPMDWLKPKKQIKELKITKIPINKDFNNNSIKTNGVRPWSAYSLFFREVQKEVRSQHIGGNISFGELSKTIARKWEKMNKKEKLVYSEQLKERRRKILRAKANVHALKLIFGGGGNNNEISDNKD